MSTITSLNYSGNYSYSPPAIAQASSSLALAAASLAAEGGVVATLGAGMPLTYDAAGLLNSLATFGTASASMPALNGQPPQAATQYASDQTLLAALPTSASGVYSAATSQSSANWAGILQQNPALASSVISDSVTQGIVGTFSAIA